MHEITTGLTKIKLKVMLSLFRYESISGGGGVAAFTFATDDVSDQLHSPAALLARK
jgi:cell division protein FtsB